MTEIPNVYELINVVGIELFTTFVNLPQIGDTDEIRRTYIKTIFTELDKFDNLLEYCNNQFADISITYNCSVPQIMNKGNIYTKKFKKHEITTIHKWINKKELFEKEFIEKNKIPIFIMKLNSIFHDNEPPNEELINSVDECIHTISNLRGFHDLVHS